MVIQNIGQMCLKKIYSERSLLIMLVSLFLISVQTKNLLLWIMEIINFIPDKRDARHRTGCQNDEYFNQKYGN